MKSKLLLILAFAFLFTCQLSVVSYELSYPEIPRLLNYQGKLTDKSGKPLDGSLSLILQFQSKKASSVFCLAQAHPLTSPLTSPTTFAAGTLTSLLKKTLDK